MYIVPNKSSEFLQGKFKFFITTIKQTDLAETMHFNFSSCMLAHFVNKT